MKLTIAYFLPGKIMPHQTQAKQLKPFWAKWFESRNEYEQALQSGSYRARKGIELHPKQRIAISLNEAQQRPKQAAVNHSERQARTEYRLSDTAVLSMQQASDSGLLSWAQSLHDQRIAGKVAQAKKFNFRDHLAKHPQSHGAAKTLLGMTLWGTFNQWLNSYACFAGDSHHESLAIQKVCRMPESLQERTRDSLCMTPAQFSEWIGSTESGPELTPDLEEYRAEFAELNARRNQRTTQQRYGNVQGCIRVR
jgi:hypothetical protein